MVRAQGADLAVAGGGVSLSEGAIEARLVFSGVAGPSAPANTRPEIVIALKGPIDAPKRTIDVAALASWLALRAVEQQSKKLDLLEGREPPAPPAPPAADIPTGSAPSQSVPATAPAAPGAARAEPESPPLRPTVRPQLKPKPTVPTAEQVPPMPPPIDIRPAPTPRAPRVQPGTAGAQGAARQAQPPAPAAAPRSLSEILFGR
jgi:hypothetical protein